MAHFQRGGCPLFWTALVLTTMLLMTDHVHAAARDLFVTDFQNDIVKRYDGDTGAFISNFTFFSGAGGMDSPRGLVFTPNASTLLVSSTRNPNQKVIQFQTSTGFVQGFLLNNVSYEDLHLGSDGALYATGTGFNVTNLYRHDPVTGAGGLIHRNISGLGLTGVSMGPDGILYATSWDKRIHRFHANGSPLGALATVPSVQAPQGLTFGPDGMLYVVSDNTSTFGDGGRVYKYNPNTGALVDQLGLLGVSFDLGGDIEFGPDGGIYLSVRERVIRVDPVTGFATQFVSPSSGGLTNAWNLAFAPGPIFTAPVNVGNLDLRMNVTGLSVDPGATAQGTNLGALLGASASSTDQAMVNTSTLTRQFTLQDTTASGLGGEPVETFVNGLLEGLLDAAGDGQASALASIIVKDLAGGTLGEISRTFEIDAATGPSSLTVDEMFGLSLLLNQDQTYKLITSLEVLAEGRNGSAQALFGDTFTVEFGDHLVPEPTTAILILLVAAGLAVRRRPV